MNGATREGDGVNEHPDELTSNPVTTLQGDALEPAPTSAPTRRPVARQRSATLALIAVVIAAAALASVFLGHHATTPPATITVTGSATVSGNPNTMSFVMGVQSSATSAVVALDENNAEVITLRRALLAHGVTSNNVQTSGLNIYQNTNDTGHVTGFTVSDNFNVATHDLRTAGAALDAAARAVGNDVQLNGVTFSISNQSSLLAHARARAVDNARTAAAQIARGANATVGAVIAVTDLENAPSSGFEYPLAVGAFGASHSVPLSPGSQSISVLVRVVYALNH